MKKCSHLIILFTTAILGRIANAYYWPLDSNGSGTIDDENNTIQYISATLGEYRPGHLHTGIDINAAASDGDIGTTVCAVEDGRFTKYLVGSDNETVRLISIGGRDLFYVHIQNNIDLIENEKITAGEVIGYLKKLNTIGWTSHLHLTEKDSQCYYNPLRPDGLDGFLDTGNISIQSYSYGNQIGFLPHDDYSEVHFPHLNGNVDIKIPAYDSLGGHNSNRVGLYYLKCEVLKGNTKIIEFPEIRFDDLPGGATGSNAGERNFNYVYASDQVYWVSKDPFSLNQPNKYWPTNRKELTPEEHQAGLMLEAQINDDAQYPDGKYLVRVITADIAARTRTAEAEVIVDNFRPYIKWIKIKQSQKLKYHARFTGIQGENIELLANNPISKGAAEVEVVFSEEMDENPDPQIRVAVRGSALSAILGQNPVDLIYSSVKKTKYSRDTWIASFNAEDNLLGDDEYYIVVGDANDTAGNPLVNNHNLNTKVSYKSLLTMFVKVLFGSYSFSPHKPIFTVEFPGSPQGILNIEAAFKVGTATNTDWPSLFDWKINYDSNQATVAFPEAGTNTGTVTVSDGNQGKLLTFLWNGETEEGLKSEWGRCIDVKMSKIKRMEKLAAGSKDICLDKVVSTFLAGSIISWSAALNAAVSSQIIKTGWLLSTAWPKV
ncbi:MAG: M23 family metallopeptidase [candidate division FCPU426 bacterium]